MSLVFLPRQLVVDTNGRPRSGAKAYFYAAGTTTPIQTWQTAAYAVPHENPVQSLASGLFPAVYIDPSVYTAFKLVITDGNDVVLYSEDNIPAESSSLRSDLASTDDGEGATLVWYPLTAAEITAGVTPVAPWYDPQEGWANRYGYVGDGVTDERAAVQQAYAVFYAGGAKPKMRGTCLLEPAPGHDYAVLLAGDLLLDGENDLEVIGNGEDNYTLFRCEGGTSIVVDVRRTVFNLRKTTPERPASTNDTALAFYSGIDSLNIEENLFKNYVEDGVYINAAFTGVGGDIHHNTFSNGYRAGVSVPAGKRVRIHHNRFLNIKLQPVNVNATNNSTVLRDIDADDNYIFGGGDANGSNDNGDRAGIAMIGKTGASLTNQQGFRCRRNTIIDFAKNYAGSQLALGIEIREITGVLREGNYVSGTATAAGKGWGIYAYLVDTIKDEGNVATGCDIGLRYNDCDNISECGNPCSGNITTQKYYQGTDGPNTYLRADGLDELLAAGSVSITAGTPALNKKYNVTVDSDVGVGLTSFLMANAANGTNYRVLALLRGASGTASRIQSDSATRTTTKFRIETLTAGVAADENYDFEVRGCLAGTVEP